MDFSFWGLFGSFVFSVFGFWMVRQGVKKANISLIGVGIALAVFPYFVPSPWVLWLCGFGLMGVSYLIW